MRFVLLEPGDERWDKLALGGSYSTLFHSRSFLNYHKGRFDDGLKYLGWLKGDELKYALSFHISSQNGVRVATTPFGASYGGFFGLEIPKYQLGQQLVSDLLALLQKEKVERCYVTLTCNALIESSADTLAFCLKEKGFKIKSENITSVVSLQGHRVEDIVNSRVLRGARKAENHRVEIKRNADPADFWPVLQANMEHLGVQSTHTEKEWAWLCQNNQGRIQSHVAIYDNKPVAGIGCIDLNSHSSQLFYIASIPEYRGTQALTLLILSQMRRLKENGFKALDFGTSTLNEIPNSALFEFKEGFGCKGYFRRSYELNLQT